METILLEGGPLDGQEWQIASNCNSVHLVEQLPLPPITDELIASQPVPFKPILYRRKDSNIFVYSPITEILI